MDRSAGKSAGHTTGEQRELGELGELSELSELLPPAGEDTSLYSEPDAPHSDVRALMEERFALSMSVPQAFFSEEAGRISEACWAMAKRFHAGGRLLAFGNGACATDAQHISVEFVHPVIVGKRALPAIALTNDSAVMSAQAAGSSGSPGGIVTSGSGGAPFRHLISVLSRPADIAVGISYDGRSAGVLEALMEGRRRGLLTVGLAGGDGGQMVHPGEGSDLDFCFVVPSYDPMVVQETHETLYHVLWELVHIFFEHEGLLVSEGESL